MRKIERIIEYINNQGISKSVFERDAKLGNSYFANTYKRGEDITAKMLERIRLNVPAHYYKIFPEEKEGEVAESEKPSAEGSSFAAPEAAKLVFEIEKLKIQLEGKDELIQSLQRVIELQDRILKGFRGNGNDGENEGGVSQTKRSG